MRRGVGIIVDADTVVPVGSVSEEILIEAVGVANEMDALGALGCVGECGGGRL